MRTPYPLRKSKYAKTTLSRFNSLKMPDSYPSYPSLPNHTAHYPSPLSRPPFGESSLTKNSFPSTSYEPHAPPDKRQSLTARNYPFLFSSVTRRPPSYQPIMPMIGYNYGCYGLFDHFQSISELEYHPPTTRIPFPHYTSNFGKATSYKPKKHTKTSKRADSPIAKIGHHSPSDRIPSVDNATSHNPSKNTKTPKRAKSPISEQVQ